MDKTSGGGYLITNKSFLLWTHEGKEQVLVDYKVFAFEGQPRFMYVSRDGSDNPETDFYDLSGNRLEMRMKDPNSKEGLPLPKNMDEMIALSARLARGTHFLRTDFYEIDRKIYCGEMTFFPSAGFVEVHPEQRRTQLGEWIKLPDSAGGGGTFL